MKNHQEINYWVSRPHVVILGAGASYSAFPNGDKNGKELPLMHNLIDKLGLSSLLSSKMHDNFEEVYSQLAGDKTKIDLREKIEEKVYDYFSVLEVHNKPTIYDYLLLSLREKDVVATFNWDPFLIQSYRRNYIKFEGKLPALYFLHGNVKVGYCQNDGVAGAIGNPCSRCKKPLSPTKLLYPVTNKNYDQDPFIASQWKELQSHLLNAFILTIFGYGAPRSDKKAIDLMSKAWGSKELKQIEIIDIKGEKELVDSWGDFIHSHHYDIHQNFYDSWIAKHPRRTVESFCRQTLGCESIDDNPVPNEYVNFNELWSWYEKLILEEKS